MSLIASHLAILRLKVEKAKLIAVSKMRSGDEIIEALTAGQRIFGENRVQEAQTKFVPLRSLYPDIELHLIGTLQTNKARMAVELFDVIQTLDRHRLADAIAKAIHETKRHPRLYIEVNIGKEPQKAGVRPDQLADFLRYCRENCKLSVTGLMCIPPQDKDPRPFFIQMRDLANDLSLPHLSMGMSNDFELAIACGATDVRIGTAIFGERGAQ